MRRLIVAGALALSGCPAPRLVSGVVFGRAADDKGVHALVSPVEGATVTWSCPPNVVGPAPQTMKTDYEGRFKSKETHLEMPETCALAVSKDGFTATHIPFAKLRDPSRSDSLRMVRAAVELRRATPEPGDKAEAPDAVHCLDLPKAGPGGFDAPMLSVEVVGNGFRLNGTPVDDKALVREVREAKAKAPDVRAIIGADRRAAYGEVMSAIDLVKQAGVAKFALSVSKGGDEPFDNVALDGCAGARKQARVAVMMDGTTMLDGTKVTELEPKLRAARAADRDLCVTVVGDQKAPHGAVFAALDAARRAKIARVAFTGTP